MFVPCSEVCLLCTVAALHCIVSAPSRAAKLQGNVHLLNSKDSISYILLSSKTQLVFAKHWHIIQSFDEEVLLDGSKYLSLSGH